MKTTDYSTPSIGSGVMVVNYNELCFPKTSNYGSMRKQGRCDYLTRSNIKRIDDVIREHEQEKEKEIAQRRNFHNNSEYQFT